MIRLGVIFGGKSPEYEISCMSAVSVIGAVDCGKYEIKMIGITRQGEWLLYDGPVDKLVGGEWEAIAREALDADPEKYGFTVLGAGGKSLKEIIDFALPVVHGVYCEDGKLQGLLEMVDIPYGGCGTTASAVAMDKIMAKEIFLQAGIPVCAYTTSTPEAVAENEEAELKRIESIISYPMYVKPANEGSSVGITKAVDRASLRDGLKEAAMYDKRLLIEEAVDCREIETGVLGNHDVKAAVAGEIIATEDFYDYDSKYVDDGRPKMKIPADLPGDISERIKDIAIRAFRAIDGEGYARCDFFIDKTDGSIYLNEINTIPGFTAFSMFPLLWESAGVPYGETIERIIGLGYERYYAAHNRKTNK